MKIEERFNTKWTPEPNTGCRLWSAAIIHNGYGQFWLDGSMKYAHRVAYEMEVGPIPEGLQLDHLCRERSCVNPDHLEPVTNLVNARRGAHAIKTHCPQGHPYDEENTYKWGTYRYCRTCARDRRRAKAMWERKGTHGHSGQDSRQG